MVAGAPAPALPRFAVGADYSTRRVHLALMNRDAVQAELIVELERNHPRAELLALRKALAIWRAETGVCVVGFEEPFVRVRDGKLAGVDATNHQTAIQLTRTSTRIEDAAVCEGYEVIYRLGANVWRPKAGVQAVSRRREDLKRAAIALVRVVYGIDCGKDDNRAEAMLIGSVTLALAHEAAMVAAADAAS